MLRSRRSCPHPHGKGLVCIVCGSFFYDVRRAFAKPNDLWGNQIARIRPADAKVLEQRVSRDPSSASVTSALAAAAAAAATGAFATCSTSPRRIYGVGVDPSSLQALAAFALGVGTSSTREDEDKGGQRPRVRKQQQAVKQGEVQKERKKEREEEREEEEEEEEEEDCNDDADTATSTVDWPPLLVFLCLTALGLASALVDVSRA